MPEILDGFQTIIPTAAAVLSEKRQMLRLTQQEIADRAKITLRQYQRLDLGKEVFLTCSFWLGVSSSLKLLIWMFLNSIMVTITLKN